jgi:D-serine deaminase-like pyridoxal phosphate-dependent protein
MAFEKQWFIIDNVNELDTPALAIYPNRVKENIQTLIRSVADINRLRPHIKTHKSSEVSKFMLEAGIKKFKCATIAEAEMLATTGAPDVLLAYQPVGPKANRLADLVKQFPATNFSCLIDNIDTAKHLSGIFQRGNTSLPVFIDLNVGMNRTGISPANALLLFENCRTLKGISIIGLHAYDGHIRDTDFNLRKKRCDEAFALVLSLRQEIKNNFNKELTIVAGGTPTYSIHCKRREAECSPGTFIYWDQGYKENLAEQDYSCAALVVTRIISKPTSNTICVDLGHKSIASENPLSHRVTFLNASNLQPIGHSEEHMVFKVEDGKDYNVGEVLYGVPYHICPTVALHDRATIVENNSIVEYWNTVSRNRKITI